MSEAPKVDELFENAADEGVLSGAATEVLGAVPDLGANIQASLGTPADDMASSEVVLVTMIGDDSASIAMEGNTDIVIEGHNEVPTALEDAKLQENILVHTRFLNGGTLSPYRPLSEAVRLDSSNYRPSGGTPLYDQVVVGMGTVTAKTQEFLDNGIAVRTITLIVSDGADTTSEGTAEDVKSIVEDLLRQENHIVAFMGIDDGRTDFRDVARKMGILDQWILTPSNNPKEIRKAFQLFSQSAVKASQTADFSQIGGFDTP